MPDPPAADRRRSADRSPPADRTAGTVARVAAGTIVARNYLPAARVLAASYQRHHPGAELTVLVVDADPDERAELAAPAPGIRVLGPGDLDLGVDVFARMAISYSVTELCTAVKPWLLGRLLADADVAIYLDPDIEVFAPFGDEVGALAIEHEIVLTPHVLEPMPRDGRRPTEADIMAAGVFNLGFIAVSAGATRFLEFWAERLRQDAISSVTEQLFTDQRWVDNVPAMFRHAIVADPGYNVAYWNVYQRPLAESPDGTITAAGRPMRFYHFSGYRPEKSWLASTHYADRPRLLLSEHPLLARLFASYRERLVEAGHAQALDDVPYRWSTLPDGTRISLSLRRTFREAWVAAERAGEPPPPCPFGSAGTRRGRPAMQMTHHVTPTRQDDFLRWASEPADLEQERAGLSRWALAVWRSRADLQHAFPDPLGDHADEFRAWCATSGVAEGELSRGAVPANPPPRTVPVRDTPGANVLGYLTAELGVGELGRLVQEAIVASGLPLATTVEEFTVGNRTGHQMPAHATAGEARYPVSVLCVNADMTATTLRLHPEFGHGRYLIGIWCWELSIFPPAMHGAFNLVDEIWTISDFCAGAIAADAPRPVHTFPVPVRDPLAGGPPAPRPADGQTRFLFAFDYNSVFERKNPTAAVTAFQRAFPGRDDVRLVIKSINGDRHPADRERLRAAAAGDVRVELVEGYLDHDEMRKLFATADCYLSLHRSEGFGLTVAEAMAHGVPAIATAYSGTAELVTPGTGWRVPYRLVPVGPGNPPYPADAHWAEPDIDAAVVALREVVDHPEQARQRGIAARRHVLLTRSMGSAAAWVRTRIETAYQQWRDGGGTRGPQPPSVAPLVAAREALRWRADVTAPSRLPGAHAMRRVVLRAIDHYDHHQRTVLAALLDGVERSVTALAGEVSRLRADTAGQLDRLDGDVTALRSQWREQLAADQAVGVCARAELDRARAAAERRIDSLDSKLVTMLGERDGRLENTDIAIAHLQEEWRTALPAIRQSLYRHHDLLSPPPAAPTEAVATDVGVLRLPAGDTVVLPWLRTYGTWEPVESRLVDALLPVGGVFVDIGAHVGYFTVRALDTVGPGGLVVAVEPWQVVRDLLELNVAANAPGRAAGTLAVIDAAAWDADGPLRLVLSSGGNSGDNRIDPAGELEVRGCRLDGLPALADRRIDVVKSDAQGRDHRALAGLSRLLEAHRPHVLCEFWPAAITEAGDDPASVLRRYRAWGYRPVPVADELVTAVEAAGYAPVRSPGPGPSDEQLVDVARSASEGFVTLWLQPPI